MSVLALEDVVIDNDGFRVWADFSLGAGRKVAIIGPSGAGKSTLVNAIAGFLPLAQGRILWAGQDITDAAPGRRPVAMLFQDGNLFPHLSAEANVGLGIRPNLRLSGSEQGRVAAALDRVGLGGLGHRRPGDLSGGQQSRAALARILVQARPVILLDEPFAALGPALRIEMLDLVSELASETGALVLMVTHDPGDARRIADDIVFLDEGRAHPPAPTQALLNDPPQALRAYLGAP
jgi:thiamine transport system ATP-binding protein